MKKMYELTFFSVAWMLASFGSSINSSRKKMENRIIFMRKERFNPVKELL
jgi:hypothetical protein